MKKKFLSLMMAAAVVATTSVSAFAAESNTYEIGDTAQEHEVTVTGNIPTASGEVVQGTISVTVPTAITFTVNKKGSIEAPSITVINNNTEKVEVVASEFVDTSNGSKITVVPSNDLSNSAYTNGDDNRYVSLTLTGKGGSVGLGSTKTQTGLYDSNGHEISKGTDQPLGFAYKDNNLTLNLTGEAKKGSEGRYEAPSKPIQDKFTLTLKIKKASQPGA